MLETEILFGILEDYIRNLVMLLVLYLFLRLCLSESEMMSLSTSNSMLCQTFKIRFIWLSPRQDLVLKSMFHSIIHSFSDISNSSSMWMLFIHYTLSLEIQSPDRYWSRLGFLCSDFLSLARKVTTVHYLIKHSYCSYQVELFTFLGFWHEYY